MKYITLLSDFGLQDASVSVVKATVMRYVPDAVITDISHSAQTFHIRQAAYLLQWGYRNFPEGTVHVVLFHVFAHRNPRMLLCRHEGHCFLAPDNGILPLALGTALQEVRQCYELPEEEGFSDWLSAAGKVAAAALDTERGYLSYPSVTPLAPLDWQPAVYPDRIECHVIYIDHFGNIVTNLVRSQFEEAASGRRFRISFMRDDEITRISRHYFEVAEGDALCRFNGVGYLEIAVNQGNAADLLGLRVYGDQQAIYHAIKIFFE